MREMTAMKPIVFKKIENPAMYFYLPETEQPVCCNTTKSIVSDYGVPLIRFPAFEALSFIEHGFSTRMGGVSSGIYESMNLSFHLEDSFENVSENFRRIAKALHTAPENMVYSKQTHTTNVMKAEQMHRGMGVVRERSYDNIDGLVTNVPGLCLVTSYADCVPLFFADKKTKSIGAAHSGWRGTVGNIAAVTAAKMQEEYGSKPEDIAVFIGPSICENCYEVSTDVAEQFLDSYSKEEAKHIVKCGKEPGKYQLNLQLANYYNLLHAGIRPENISISDICTCCNPKLLFSHRASKGRRGILCGFIYIKE